MGKHRGRWPGTWSVICDVCGWRFPSDKVRERWDGKVVCHEDYEARHILDFFRVTSETHVPHPIRPEPPLIEIDVPYPLPKECTYQGSSGIAGMGVAGCMTAGRVIPGLL